MNRQTETAIYIINRYYAWKIKKDRGLPKYCDRFPLKKVGYTIDMISNKEIFFSFLLIVIIIITIISGLTAFVLVKQGVGN